MIRTNFDYLMLVTFLLVQLYVVAIQSQSSVQQDQLTVKRSAVCLIDRVAQYNKVTATYEMINNSTDDHNKLHFTYKLDLGNETYRATAGTVRDTKEKVAREAYSHTKFEKPNLKNRTCVVDNVRVKNDVSILYEYATHLGKNVMVEETQLSMNPSTYKIELTLEDRTASATGIKKKKIKEEAATRLVNIFGRENIVSALVQKYNESRYHSMEPSKRLQKVMLASGELKDIVFTVEDEYEEYDNNLKAMVRIVISKLVAGSYEAVGTGRSLTEANNDAAAKALEHMKFTVTYSHPTTA